MCTSYTGDYRLHTLTLTSEIGTWSKHAKSLSWSYEYFWQVIWTSLHEKSWWQRMWPHTQTKPLILKFLLCYKILVGWDCKKASNFKRLLTLILLEANVFSFCHQYRVRPACTSMQPDQASYCWLTNFKFSSWYP